MKTSFAIALCAGVTLGAFGQSSSSGTFALRGKVVDTDGRPVEGATVERFQFGRPDSLTPHELEVRQQVKTGPDGLFELRASRTTVFLLARKPGYAPAWRMFTATPGVEHQLVLAPRTAQISGVVVDETGQPVTNAEVWVTAVAVPEPKPDTGAKVNLLFSRPARYCFMTNTGPDGRFSLAGFPTNATVDFAVRAPGRLFGRPDRVVDLTNADALPYRAGQQDVQIVLTPAGCIEGKIVSEETTNPAPVIRVSLQADGPGYIGLTGREPVAPDPDGSFTILDILPGVYSLKAVFDTNALPSWSSEPVRVTVSAGQTNRDVTIVARSGTPLQVIVLSKTDRSPVPDAEVAAYSQTFSGRATSDADGKALLWLPPGEYQLIARKRRWGVSEVAVTITAGQTNHEEIELSPPLKLAGVVRYPDGSPASGLDVVLIGANYVPSGEAVAKADTDGRFEFEWTPLAYRGDTQLACVMIRDITRNLVAAREVGVETHQLELELAPGLTVMGQVECLGQPVTNVEAALVFRVGEIGFLLSGMNVKSNVPGLFEIPALPAGRNYSVEVSAQGYSKKLVNVPDTEANRIELGTIELKQANLELAGQVLDEEDRPVPDAQVSLSGPEQPSAGTRTDRNGRFRFDQVCDGEVMLYVSTPDSYAFTRATPGDTNVVIRLATARDSVGPLLAGKLNGVVLDPEGKPAAGVPVAILPNEIVRPAVTDSKGRFSINWVVSGSLSGLPCVVVWDTNRNLAVAEDIEEGTTQLKLRLKQGLIVTGCVRDTDEKPITNATVTASMSLANFIWSIPGVKAHTDTQGRFGIPALPAGKEFRLRAEATGYGTAYREVVTTEDETNRIELEPFVLKIANRRLAGRVVDAKDKPVPGASVNLSGKDQPSESVKTDKDGRFTFTNVCEGWARLFAYKEAAYANVTAEAGDTNVLIMIRPYDESETLREPRARLIGKSLPDLRAVGLDPLSVQTGKPLLVCLFDSGQRPSRRCLRLLSEQHEALKAKGLAVVAVQVTPTTTDAFNAWKASSPMPFPVGYVHEESDQTRWATAVESLPWLILADAQGRVIAEGFAIDELEVKLEAVTR